VFSPCAAVRDDAPATAWPGAPLPRTPRPASRFSVLPQQAPYPSLTGGSNWLTRAHRFPQPVWTTSWSKRWRLRDHSRRGLPRQRHRAALNRARLVASWQSTVASGDGSPTSGFPGIPGRAAVSGPACTVLRRQGRAVARAAGPHHRRPQLRHRTHRRGDTSAASSPPKAHAQAVSKVRLSAQRSADRSGQPRSKGRCAAGLPPPCAGRPGDVLAPRRLGNALERTLRLA
jgi:hypothetical protein